MHYLYSGSCKLAKPVAGMMIECNSDYSILNSDNRNFTVGWYLDVNNTYSNLQNDQMTKLEKSYKYFDMIDLKNPLPYWGWHATYSGGGYVAELGSSSFQAHRLVTQLVENNWIDYYTRAVFLEFTIYNPGLNLFAFVNYLMEFPPTGAVFPSERIYSFQVRNVHSSLSQVTLSCVRRKEISMNIIQAYRYLISQTNYL